MADEAKKTAGTTTEDGKRRATAQRAEPSGKTTARTSTSVDPAPTPQTSTSTTTTPTAAQAPSTPSATPPEPLPEPSPRNHVAVNVGSVTAAFHDGAKTRSIRAIQSVLVARGFSPGNTDGLADYGTRAAYAKFQQSIDERPTGIPTADSLDTLGFDVVG